MGAGDNSTIGTAHPLNRIAQPVAAPLTCVAIFLVVKLKPEAMHRATIRSFCGDFAALSRAVGARDLDARLSCVIGFGSDAWDQLFGLPRPAELRRPSGGRCPRTSRYCALRIWHGACTYD